MVLMQAAWQQARMFFTPAVQFSMAETPPQRESPKESATVAMLPGRRMPTRSPFRVLGTKSFPRTREAAIT